MEENLIRQYGIISNGKFVPYGMYGLAGGKKPEVLKQAEMDEKIASGELKNMDAVYLTAQAAGQNGIIIRIDPYLIADSTNAIQNKAVYAAVDGLQTEIASDKNHIARALAGYNGKDLGKIYTPAQFKAKIESGDFSGTDLGDFFDITLTTGEKMRYVISGYNTYLNYGYSVALEENHVIMTPVDCMAETKSMNTTNTNAVGYAGSIMPAYLESIISLFPQEWRDVMLAIRRKENNKGGSEWATRTLFLLSETEVNGHTVWSDCFDCGTRPLPLYQYSARYRMKGLGYGASEKKMKTLWWLASPSAKNNTDFCNIQDYGEASQIGASNSIGIVPAFCV